MLSLLRKDAELPLARVRPLHPTLSPILRKNIVKVCKNKQWQLSSGQSLRLTMLSPLDLVGLYNRRLHLLAQVELHNQKGGS